MLELWVIVLIVVGVIVGIGLLGSLLCCLCGCLVCKTVKCFLCIPCCLCEKGPTKALDINGKPNCVTCNTSSVFGPHSRRRMRRRRSTNIIYWVDEDFVQNPRTQQENLNF